MIHVVIQEEDEILGEMRIERIEPGLAPDSGNYIVEYAVEDGPSVDLKRRTLYDHPDKYNVLALVDAALSLLELNEMEKPDGAGSGRMARRQRRAGGEISQQAADQVRDHRSPFWRR